MREHYPDIDINTTLSKGGTILHEITQTKSSYRSYKNCARLLLLGANPAARDSNGKTPFFYLKDNEKARISKLQTQIAHVTTSLSQHAPDVLVERITIDNGRILKSDLLKMLNDLYNLSDIAPLLDLAKLCVLGFHDLASSLSYDDKINYDSDNDDNARTNIASKSEKLSIRLDAAHNTVECMHYFGRDGLGGSGALGVYSQALPNIIFIGAQWSGGNEFSQDLIRSTIIHELVHFLANELYKNSCKPYFDFVIDAEATCVKIMNHLSINRNILDPILATIFNYESYHHHSELIVRVAQMIVCYARPSTNGGIDGITRLEQQVSPLLAFYRDEFISHIKGHTEKLIHQAMGCWPLELFEEKKLQLCKI